MQKYVKIVMYAAITLFTVLMVALCAICAYTAVRKLAYGEDIPTVFGYGAATVATGSMEPTISQGDLIIIKVCDSYEQDDIITFYDSEFGGYVTHRIIEVSDDGLYVTKGDANDSPDTRRVSYSQVKGKVALTISGAGSLIEFMQTPAGIICIIIVLAGIWLIVKVISVTIKKIKEAKSTPVAEEAAPDANGAENTPAAQAENNQQEAEDNKNTKK